MIVDKEIDYDGFRRYSNQLIRKVYDAKVAKGFKDDREKIAQRNKDSIIAARKREKEADVLGRRHELDI
mgnify:FL=1